MGQAGCTSRRRKRTASLAVSLRTMAEKIVANASTYQPPMGMRLKNDRQKMPASAGAGRVQGFPGAWAEQSGRGAEGGEGEQQDEQVADRAGDVRRDRAAAPECLGEQLPVGQDQQGVYCVGRGEGPGSAFHGAARGSPGRAPGSPARTRAARNSAKELRAVARMAAQALHRLRLESQDEGGHAQHGDGEDGEQSPAVPGGLRGWDGHGGAPGCRERLGDVPPLPVARSVASGFIRSVSAEGGYVSLCTGASGSSSMRAQSPPPAWLARVRRPPRARLSCCAMARPRPVPPVSRLREFSTR